MNETTAALLGGAIVAIAGLAGGGFAALASIRASQIAARAALAPKLHKLARAIVHLSGAAGTNDETRRLGVLEIDWHDFSVHQRILCPSKTLEVLADLMRRTTKEYKNYAWEDLAKIAGQIQEKAARIVGLHSAHLFGFRARWQEKKVITDWLAGEAHGLLGDELRQKMAKDLGLWWWQRKRIKPADPTAPSVTAPARPGTKASSFTATK